MYKEITGESMVSPVARRYTRIVNGRECLVVCLSEYLPLRSVYRISCMSMIAIYFSRRGLFREEITNRLFFFKCRLGLPVVPEVSSVVTMTLIDMYILHDSSLAVSFLEYIGVFCVNLDQIIMFTPWLARKCCSRRFRFTPFPRMRRVGIGLR